MMNDIDASDVVSLLKSTGDDCPTITVSHLNDTTVQIEVDYGEGCGQFVYGQFGNVIDTIVREGKIIIVRTGRYSTHGPYRTVTLEYLYINGIHMEGTHTIQNMGYDNNGHMWFSITLQNGKITAPDGLEITRNSERERHWVAGEETLTPWDDEYKIWGSVDGFTANGENYTRAIIDSLHVSLACRFILSGKIESEVGDREPTIFDYGNGDCNAEATLSRGEYSKEIELRFRPKLRNR